MNIITSPFKDYRWVTAGSIGGIITGTAVNLLRGGSIFKSGIENCLSNSEGIEPFTSINRFREHHFRSMPAISTRWTLPFPVSVYMIPLIGFTLWNTIPAKDSAEWDIKSFAKRGWHQVSNNIIYPLASNEMEILLSQLIRDVSSLILCSLNLDNYIDISGHVVSQVSLTIFGINSLAAIAKTGTSNQKKLYSIMLGIVAVTDGIFMHFTAANCHSVADVVSGVAVVGLAHLGIQASKALLYKRFNLARDKHEKTN